MVSQMGLEPRWQPGLLAEGDVLAVELNNEDQPLGIELVGTTEDSLRSGGPPPGVFISAVFAGGPTAADGRIRRGMQLVVGSVNSASGAAQ